MSRRPQAWRDEFLARMVRECLTANPDPDNPGRAEILGRMAARYLLMKSATLQRLAEAQCNGDWPADAGSDGWKTAECESCAGLWAPAVLKRGIDPDTDGTVAKVCPDCRATWAVRRYMVATLPGWLVEFQGDPRGAVVRVYPPRPECTHPADPYGTRQCSHRCGIGVP